MPRLLARQMPHKSERYPEPFVVDGLLVNGYDAMSAKRADHRAALEAERAVETAQKRLSRLSLADRQHSDATRSKE